MKAGSLILIATILGTILLVSMVQERANACKRLGQRSINCVLRLNS